MSKPLPKRKRVEGHEVQLVRFTNWLAASGAHIDALRIQHLGPSKGFGAVAASNLFANSPIVAVPEALLLGARAARSHPELGPALSQLTPADLPPITSRNASSAKASLDRALTQLLLLWEARVAGNGSRWAAYIDMLPRSFDAALWWDSDRLESLASTPLLRTVVLTKETIIGDLRGLLERLQKGPSAAHFDPAVFDYDGLCWACGAFWSRALVVPKRMGELLGGSAEEMVPGVDMLNHRPGALTHFQWSGTGQLVAHTAGSIEKGKPVEINYGGKGNGELLTYFGFCLPDNPADVLPLSISATLADGSIAHCSINLHKAQEGAHPTESISAYALDTIRNMLEPTPVQPADQWANDPVSLVYCEGSLSVPSEFGFEMQLEIGEPKNVLNEQRTLQLLLLRLTKEVELLTEASAQDDQLVQVYCKGMMDIVDAALSGVQYLHNYLDT